MSAMGGVIRRYWWLPLGLVLAVLGTALITSVGRAAPCSEVDTNGQLLSGGTCQDEIDALARSFNLGSIFLIVGLMTIASGLGYRLGQLRQRTGGDPIIAAAGSRSARRRSAVPWYWVIVVVGLAAAVGGVVLLRAWGSEPTSCSGFWVGPDPSAFPGQSACEAQLNAAARTWWSGAALIAGAVVMVGLGLGIAQGRRVRERLADAALA